MRADGRIPGSVGGGRWKGVVRSLIVGAAWFGVAHGAGSHDPVALLRLDGARPGIGETAEALCGPEALKAHAAGSLEAAFKAEAASLDTTMARHEAALAVGEARNAAAAFSYCYIRYGRAADEGLYAAAVGHFLALAVQAEHEAQMVNGESASEAERARELLEYARGQGQETAADLRQLEAFAAPKEPASQGHDFRTTARALVTEFQANELAFRAKYAGHTIAVTGRARALTALPDGRALATLVGLEGPGHGRLIDEITCEITSSSDIARAARWTMPATVTVIGTYRGPTGVATRIVLNDCRPASP